VFRILPPTLILALASVSMADVVTIEGFENFNDPGNWGVSTNVAGQTQNATVSGNVPEYVQTNVTEGVLAGKFTAAFIIPGSMAASNPYEAAGPLTYWSVRYNVNAPSGLPLNSIPTATGFLQADIRNDSPYPVSVALVVDNSEISELKRGPLMSVPAASSIIYSWDFASQSPVALGEGADSFNGDEQRLKSFVVYTVTQPTGDLSVTVDNIRNASAEDLTAPLAPRILSLQQAAAPGTALVRWEGSPDADVAQYNLYVSSDANFNTAATNRLIFPTSPVATVGAEQTTATLTGLAVDQNVYVAVTAVDNATTPNESNKSQVLTARLRADGTAPQDLLVLDNDLYTSESPAFVTSGYFHASVYTAQALHGLGRTFDSVTDEAITSGLAPLAAATNGIVIWSNLQDGTGADGSSLTPASIAAIQNFTAANGKLLISGSAVAEDLSERVDGAITLANTFSSTLQTSDVMISTILPFGAVDAPSSLSTGLNPASNTVAYSTASNDGIKPLGNGEVVFIYNGVPMNDAVAGVGVHNSMAFLGFAIESAGDPAGSSASAQVRQTLLSELIAFLTEPRSGIDWQLYI